MWVSAVLLAALVVTVNAWTTRHLGWGLETCAAQKFRLTSKLIDTMGNRQTTV